MLFSSGGGKLSRVQQQLLRALEPGDAIRLSKDVRGVSAQLDVALKDLNFSRQVVTAPPSRIFDCQQHLLHALESGDGLRLARQVSEVVRELEVALKDLKFKRADFWGPDTPDWKPVR